MLSIGKSLMKTLLKTILKALGWTGLCLLFGWLGYVCVRADMAEIYERGYKAGYDYIKPISVFQRQIGCEKIDNKVSPDWRNSETQALWEKAYGNQSANVFYTASGKPRQGAIK